MTQALPKPDSYLARHPEQVFIAKAGLTILAILLLRDAIRGWLPLILLLFPVAFLFFVRVKAAAAGEHPDRMLARYVTLTPVAYVPGESRFKGIPAVTWSLIALNAAVFYGFEPHVDPDWASDNLLFLPHAPNLWNVPLSAVTAMFLHGSPTHLWGNMIFLWSVGTVVERRIGWRAFLGGYLGSGLVAGLVAVSVAWLWTGELEHGLGASGAIAGVMGIFAVRCYFKTMVFPLPILGIFSLIIPLSVRFRVNSLVVIGLFFLADLSGGIDQLAGRSYSSIGHWGHVGGMLAGIGFAALLSLGSEAAEERHLDIADTALETGEGIKAGRASLHRILEKEPDNPDALLGLARMESRFHACEEGRLAYARCIEVLAASDPERAAGLFEEYLRRYPACLEARLQYRLTPHLFMRNPHLTARVLEALAAGADTPPEIAEKSLFQLGKVYEAMGLPERSRDVYRRYADRYPDSAVSAKARNKAEGIGWSAPSAPARGRSRARARRAGRTRRGSPRGSTKLRQLRG